MSNFDERAIRAVGPQALNVAWELIQCDGFWTAIARRSGLCVEASESTERAAFAVAYARLITAEQCAIDRLAWKGSCRE